MNHPNDGRAAQARLTAQRIEAIRHEFGYLTAQQIDTKADQDGSAERWNGERRIVGFDVDGQHRYPAFQFDADGQPLPIIGDLIEVYQPQSGYVMVAWLTSPTGWLDGARPVDLLISDPAAVREAALAGRAGQDRRARMEALRAEADAARGGVPMSPDEVDALIASVLGRAQRRNDPSH